MKKKVIFLFAFLLSLQLSHGQNYRQDRGFLLGINASYLYPTGDMGKILKNGLGGNITAKYLINEVIGIGFEAGYYAFKSKIGEIQHDTEQSYKAHLLPALLEATFYIPTWNRTTLPYLGIQFGGYMTQIKITQSAPVYSTQEPDFSKKLFLFSPGAGLHGGVLFQLASDRLWMDIRLRADYVPKISEEYDKDEYTKGNIGFSKMMNIGGNIGILYKF